MSVEAQFKFDKTGGVGKSVGKAWFDAARYGDMATMKKLFKTNPKLIHYNGSGTSYGFIGNTALQWAVSRGDALMSGWLLSKGSYVNHQNHGGSTPLHTACAHGEPAMVSLLLQHAAVPHLVDCCGDTPADVIPPASKREVLPLIEAFGVVNRLRKTKSVKWSVAEMREVVQLAGEDPDAYIEKKELEAKVAQLLKEYEARVEAAEQREIEATQAAIPPEASMELDEEDIQAATDAKDKGNRAFQEKDYKTAIRLYTMAIKIVNTDAVFYSNRAACYLSLHQPAKALEDAIQAVQLDPSYAKGYHRLGSAALQLGRFAEAHKAYKEGLALKPNDASLQEGAANSAAMLRMELAEENGGVDASDSEEEDDEGGVTIQSTQKAEEAPPVKPRDAAAAPPRFVPHPQRHPWFECPNCENRTRDHTSTPCCNKDLCGTCLKRNNGRCPYCK